MPFYIRVPSLITPVHCITKTEEPQTSDVSIESVAMRRMTLFHYILSFILVAVVIGLVVNIISNLI